MLRMLRSAFFAGIGGRCRSFFHQCSAISAYPLATATSNVTVIPTHSLSCDMQWNSVLYGWSGPPVNQFRTEPSAASIAIKQPRNTDRSSDSPTFGRSRRFPVAHVDSR